MPVKADGQPERMIVMERLSERVLLIGWDGADWKMINPLLEQGLMPNLAQLVDVGVIGNVASLTPMLSPILWTSIATGKHADKHGILGFAEPETRAGEATGEIRPVTSTSRKCKALWNLLPEGGLTAGVVNWFASHPAEPINGFVVTDRYAPAVGAPDKEWPLVAGSVYPPELLEELCQLRIHPAATTPMQVAPFIPKLAELDVQQDQNLHQLRILLAHCATVHAAATYLMQERDWDFCGIYYDAIDRLSHTFMEYVPPKMEHVSEEDFERYQDVMTGCYRFHDMMLGRLVQLAGEDATIIIVSDHGFHSDHLRPAGSAKIKDGRPVAWHRQHGILAIAGPNIKKDQRVYGASLLDIAPTVLWLLGCPVARDMDGKALAQILDRDDVAVERIASYETGEAAVAAASESKEDPWVAQQILERLAGLGYIEKNESVEGVALDRLRNLGQVYAATGRPQEAIKQYEQVLAKKPDDKGCKIAIAACRLELGQLDACEQAVEQILSDQADAPQANLYMGIISFRRCAAEAALPPRRLTSFNVRHVAPNPRERGRKRAEMEQAQYRSPCSG